MATTTTRRDIIQSGAALALAALALPVTSRGGLAHQDANATPVADPFGALGLPELTITATDDAYTASATELAAGRYLVTLDNQASSELYAQFVALDDTLTIDAVAAALADPTAEAPPEWFYTAVSPGGSTAFPGTSARFVVDLPAGSYAVHHSAPGVPLAPVELTVTGEMPADVPAIDAPVTVSMVEMAFNLTGDLTSGTQLVALANDGAQHHFTIVLGVPDGTTVEDFLAFGAAMAAGPEASPVPLKLSFEDLRFVFESAVQSPGTTMWGELTLDPGTYILSCFVPDPATGAPHAMLGMTNVVVVA